MVREGRAIGSIAIGRAEVGAFSERQIKLLCTFADQAVIAIENVRLFAELEARNHDLTESLEQQTATSEILRVISSSPNDLQPVFDIIAESAAKLCGAEVSVVTRFDGEWVDLKAVYGSSSAGTDALREAFPMRATGVAAAVRAIRDRAITHIPDVLVDEEYGIQEAAVAGGFRAALAVPMLRDGRAIGSVGIGRSEAGEFSERQIKLLRTFADQAMIAIENVRLFTELGARNHDLTEALEQQTATSEILRVISQSPTDVQPVFHTIASSAVRLCDALYSGVYQSDGDLIRMVAHHQIPPRALEEFSRVYPMRLSEASGPVGRAIQGGSTVHITDALNDPTIPPYALRFAHVLGYRSQLVVPMVRQGTCIGAISIVRTEVRPFSDTIIALIQTFADQAVIAIENVRLFKELQARTSELTRSVSQLTALGEISQAVSSTLDVETVLETIVFRATQLAGADGCAIYEYDDATEAFHIRATHNLDPALVATLRAEPLRKGEGAMGRAAETREPTQVADIATPGAYQSHIRDTLLGAGYRALLSVPLLREGEIIGSLSLNRHAPGEFPPEAVEVLKTFATQSALAIQNARLFREIADKSRQLEAASRHKSEFLANMSHELRTPLNAIIGFSEVLNERMFGELNDKQAEYLKDIHASGTHLLSLINDILDLSKVEAGRMELELSDFSLPSAIDSALTLVRERATRRGITLRAAIHDGIGEISGDERKIRQVLLNLLSNAIKFTPEGGRIEVQAVPEAGAVDVSVSDTGVGIAPEEQEAAFEEFRQVGASAAKQEGTGLGLALCRKFVELHGGKIWVTSALGSGSTFTFRLPTTPA
jgi:signal transduction histidine kinase